MTTDVGTLGPASVAIYAGLLDAPGDMTAMLVLSDALEEESKTELAAAYRHAAEHGLWPFQRPAARWRGEEGSTVWDWDLVTRQWPSLPPVPDCARLPLNLFRAIKGLPDRKYGTVHDAFVLLGRALAALSSSQETPTGEGKT